MPSSTIPDHISGIANERCDWRTKKPIPFVLATISLITIMITASDRLVRMPAKICGAAAGSTTSRSRSTPRTP